MVSHVYNPDLRGCAWFFLIIAMTAAQARPAMASEIVSDFEVDDEGWLVGGSAGPDDAQGTLTHMTSGGNPGGFIQIEDTLSGVGNVLSLYAPDRFVGDLSSFFGATVSFDAIFLGGTWDAPGAFGLVQFRSESDMVTWNPGVDPKSPPTRWTNLSVPLVGTSFGVTDRELLTILGDVTQLRLIFEDNGGTGEVTGFDNFIIGPPCVWDLDRSGDVGITDFLALLAAWGTDPGGPPDFDGDGTVGITDFLELLAQWGPCPP